MKFTNYNKIKIGVIGLGYVGLPLLVELSKKLNCIGYDKNLIRLKEIKKFQEYKVGRCCVIAKAIPYKKINSKVAKELSRNFRNPGLKNNLILK